MLPDSPEVRLVELHERKSILGLLSMSMKLLSALREGAYDVVHTHMFHANIIARLIRPLVRCPVLVSTAHSNVEGGYFRMLMYRYTDRFTDLTTNVSASAVRRYIKIGAAPDGKIRAVYNGIDVSKFNPDFATRLRVRMELGLAREDFVVLAVGRLTKAKNYPLLIDAFADVCSSIRHARLVIVGDGPLAAELREQVSRLENSELVTFLGSRDNVPELMNMADLFVLASQWEGFGLAAAEAMATEIPIVVTDAGGLPEVVGDAGTVVPSGDRQALAASMRAVAQMPVAARARQGKAGRKRVETHFSLRRTADEWLHLYDRLLLR